MKIIFIRHAESLGNIDEYFYMFPESANILSKRGVHQSLALRDRLTDVVTKHFNRETLKIISSNMIRAKLTADIATCSLKLPIIQDKRLNEVEVDNHGRLLTEKNVVINRISTLIDDYKNSDLILFTHYNVMAAVFKQKHFKNTAFEILDDVNLKLLLQET